MYVQNLINKTAVKIFDIHKNKTFNKFSTCINEFYSKCPAESLRSTTMELIIKIHDILSGDKYFETICNIIKFHETIVTENVPQNIWENAWKISIEIVSQKTYARTLDALNRLFHICKPETKERKALINKIIKELLENQKTFYRGIRLIKYIILLKMNFSIRHVNFYSNFPVESIRIVTMELIIKIFHTLSRTDNYSIYSEIKWISDNFKSTMENTDESFVKAVVSANVPLKTWKNAWILFNCFLYKKYRNVFHRFFSSPEEKFLTLQILDNCLKRIESNKAPKSKAEEKFREIFSVETLAEMIQKRAKKYGIEIEGYNFYTNKIFFIQKMKNAYDFMDKVYFELYVLEQLKDQEEKYKLDFLEVISHDSKYAYTWAKKLEISQENIPIYLKNNEHFKADDKIIPKEVSIYVEKDFIETCKFWEKSYKFFTVMTPEAFDAFIFECFIKEKPKIIGIDCEADDINRIALLQLATRKWICLIDIQTLFNQISENKWEKFFERLFHPSILRVGFSFQNDYRFLCRKFPFLLNLFSQNLQKVLQALAISIFEKEIDSSSIFGSDFFSNSGLAKLSKSVLNITLDKSLQRSDWSKRPLTQLQKIYAVSDALIVVLIYDKTETRLIKKLGYFDAEEMIKNGFITFTNKKNLFKNLF
uniref:3'-5' exonuclease domain-containing protein n=1 Tax=Panagrolaimus davidi TaxID=227884 RepID=A0A914P099_9BILA